MPGYRELYAAYYIVLTILGGIVIHSLDGIGMVDAIFVAASGLTCSGLSTVAMSDLSWGSFATLAVLMILGQSVIMLLPAMIYRRICYVNVMDELNKLKKENRIPEHMKAENKRIIREYETIYYALGIVILTVITYFFVCHLVCVPLLLWALASKPNQPELQARGFTYFDNALFLAIGSFSNGGFSLASDNAIGLYQNPAAYTIMSVLIVLGNTAIPNSLRLMISALRKIDRHREPSSNLNLEHSQPARNPILSTSSSATATATATASDLSSQGKQQKSTPYRRALDMILDHPRRITTHIFGKEETKFLLWMIIALNLVEYVFFLASVLSTHEDSNSHYTNSELAGIGFFQTISTRSAGFSMIDLRTINQGMIFLYAVMMYISSAPFVSTMQSSNANATSEDAYVSSDDQSTSAGGGEVEMQQLGTTVRLSARHLAASSSQSSRRMSAKRRLSTASDGTVAASASAATAALVNSDSNLFSGLSQQYLMKHSFFLLLAVIVCSYSEDHLLISQPAKVNLWYIIFEIISAYGNVGLSMGYPGVAYSLSGKMSILGKLTLVVVMWLGKWRGLPDNSDEVIDFKFNKLRVAALSSGRRFVQTSVQSEGGGAGVGVGAGEGAGIRDRGAIKNRGGTGFSVENPMHLHGHNKPLQQQLQSQPAHFSTTATLLFDDVEEEDLDEVSLQTPMKKGDYRRV